MVRVPYGKAVYGDEEIDAVVNALKKSTQMGEHVEKFETHVSSLFNKKYGIMVNSGSSANYLAIEILNLPKGSEVITPILTFATVVAPIIKNDLVPSFVDVEEGTYNIDVNKIEEMITPKTKAIMIPNLIGNLPDWKKIRSIADKHNLVVIEDSCDTLGATIEGVSSGNYSDISICSFYGSHVITCAGNGGILCVNDEKLLEKAKLLRSWGRSSSLFKESEKIENRFNVNVGDLEYDAKFIFSGVGYNYEPSEIGAAFGLVQLNKLDNNISIRESNFKELYDFFMDYKQWFILPKQLPSSRTGWLAFPLTIKESAPFTRKEFQIYLEENDIQTRTVFTGNILKQPGYMHILRKENLNGYPKTDEVMKGGVLLGCHHGLNQEMLDYMKNVLKSFFERFI